MIFGIQAPKMIVNIDTTQDEVVLDYSVVLKDEPELDTFEAKSVRTGKRDLTNAGKHWIFQVKIHLWKYADPKAKYLELKSYEGTEVILYRHLDGEPIYDTYGNGGHFILFQIEEKYLEEIRKSDIIILTFRSIDYISQSAPPLPSGIAYYMNRTEDTPQGSIDLINSKLFEINHIGVDVRLIRNTLLSPFIAGTVNGYYCLRYNYLTSGYAPAYYCNTTEDIFTDNSNICLIISFERKFYSQEVYGDYTIFSHYNTAGTAHLELYINSLTGYLTAVMTNGATTITATINQNFMDEQWHVAAVNFNQTDGIVTINTENSYEASASNPSYMAADLTAIGIQNPTLGTRSLDGVTFYNKFGEAGTAGGTGAPFIGDVFIFFDILAQAQINEKGQWIANRLSITWNNI